VAGSLGLDSLSVPRNPFFSGRAELLDEIQQRLLNSAILNRSNTQVVYGLGGIGKTQVALEYAYRCSDAYQYIIWIEANGESQLDSGYRELTRRLGIPVGDVDDTSEVRHVLRRWLSNQSGYLLIFDGADDPEALRSFFSR
jgi:DNA transposition AAA+ family ATPase